MSLEHQGYVGLFQEKFSRERVEALVVWWLANFGGLEQVSGYTQVSTFTIRSVSDLIWEKDLQFRVLAGEQFSWVYLTLDRWVIETSGLRPPSGRSLSHDVLLDAPGCIEIIDEHNDRRLDQLEAKGLM